MPRTFRPATPTGFSSGCGGATSRGSTPSTAVGPTSPSPGRAPWSSGRKIPVPCCPASRSFGNGVFTVTCNTPSTTTKTKDWSRTSRRWRSGSTPSAGWRSTWAEGLVVWRFDPPLLTDRLGTEEAAPPGGAHRRQPAGCGRKTRVQLRGHRHLPPCRPEPRPPRHPLAGVHRRGDAANRRGTGRPERTVGLHARHMRRTDRLRASGHRPQPLHRRRAAPPPLSARPRADGLPRRTPPSPALFGETARPERTAAHPPKDRGQRAFCGCIASADIGQYATCPHLCAYCYANRSERSVAENLRLHRLHPFAETITGR